MSADSSSTPSRRERIAEAAPFALAAAVGLYVSRARGLENQLTTALGMALLIPSGGLFLLVVCEYTVARIAKVADREALPDRLRTYAAVLALVVLYGLAQRWREGQLEQLVACIQDEQTTDYGTRAVTSATLRYCATDYHDDEPYADFEP
jgi:hypothetical protein